MRLRRGLALLAVLTLAAIIPANARTLAAVQESGHIGLCAHPNSLPFASKTQDPPGLQIELGTALAKQMGVSLTPDWVLISYQVPRTNCDFMLDMVASPGQDLGYGLKLTKPYYRSGIALAVPPDSRITSFADLGAKTKVGVQTGSIIAMTLDQKHIPISIFGFEDDMLEALAAHEIDAAAVTPVVAGYYNTRHSTQQIRIVPPEDTDAGLAWNIAIGVRRPDPALMKAVETALDQLTADGTVARIYGRYGVTLQPPK